MNRLLTYIIMIAMVLDVGEALEADPHPSGIAQGKTTLVNLSLTLSQGRPGRRRLGRMAAPA
jgi:hypothetical protein